MTDLPEHLKTAVEPQNEALTHALADARQSYDFVKLADSRSDEAARDFVARSAILVREARQDRAGFNALCKANKFRIGTKRVETLAIRLGAADPGLRRTDWANAAAELVDRLSDALTVEAAKQTIRDTHGGIRGLSDLRAGRIAAAEAAKNGETVSLLEWADAGLFGIPADLDLSPSTPSNEYDRRRSDQPDTYVLLVAKINRTGSSGKAWVYEEADDAAVRRLITKIKNRKITETGPAIYIERCARALLEDPGSPDLSTQEEPGSAVAAMPRGEAAVSADEDAVPSDEDAVPSDEAAVPSDEAAVPSDEAAVPADEAAVASDEAAVPADEAALPADKAAVPADKAAVSADEAAVLVDDARPPVSVGLVKRDHRPIRRRSGYSPQQKASGRVRKEGIKCSLTGCGCQHGRRCRQAGRCMAPPASAKGMARQASYVSGSAPRLASVPA